MGDRNSLSPENIVNSYYRFVPFQMLNLLGKEDINNVRLGDQMELKLTILFSDIRGFTTISESLSPKESFDFINSYLAQMDSVITFHHGIIDKFLGDGIMAIFPTNADDALNCSILMLKQLDHFNESRMKDGYKPIKIGIGLNTGLCMLGIVGGINRMESTVFGDAVNLSSRLEFLTKLYGVNLLVGESLLNNLSNIMNYSIRFIDRVIVKGKNRPQSVYEVFDSDSREIRKLKNETKPLFEEALANYHYKKVGIAKNLLKKCIQINPEDQPAKVYLERCEAFLKSGVHEGANELCQQIEWSSDFEIGNKVIDKQHFELISNSVKLLHFIERDVDKSEIDDLISFLNDYVVKHFKTEEKFLQNKKYPFYNDQKKQHLNFIRSFEILKEEIRTSNMSKTYLMFRIQILLIDWVINHTLKEDQHYKKYSRSISQK
jgi:hemerythrin-like metal-binding protein